MRPANEKSPRRSSLSQFFSPIRHHEQVVRKRAQSLHAQSTRVNSILHRESASHLDLEDPQTNTPDKRSNFKLSISAPLPASSPTKPTRFDTESSSSLKQLRSSFIETRHHDEPPSSSERKVQFVEPQLLHHHHRQNHATSTAASEPSSFPSDTTTRSTSSACRKLATTEKRTVARVSISTGKLYYIQEPIPEYPLPRTYFSPPPSPSRSHAYHHSHSFNFTFRRASQHRKHTSLAGVCPHLRQRSATSGLDSNRLTRGHDSRACGELQRESDSSGTSTPSSTARSESRERHHFNDRREESPLYTSTSEKFHAHWGAFAFNMRFSMFRAQDRMKDGVAWMGDVVRRMKTGRQL